MGTVSDKKTTMISTAHDRHDHMLTAYTVIDQPSLRLVPAYAHRDWMQRTRNHFANRCLPLVMANQWGWFVLNSHDITVVWNGGIESDAVVIRVESTGAPSPASSHFGHGIITWHLPWVFRTPPGFNLLIRGPANWPKDGAVALDGMVEADWSVTTFTMNWQITRKATPIRFARDEPIAMLVPQKRGELEQFDAIERPIHADPALEKDFQAWSHSRDKFLRDLPRPGTQANQQGWQKHYTLGRRPDGVPALQHQTKLVLKPFRDACDRPSPKDDGRRSTSELILARKSGRRLRRIRGNHAGSQ